MEESALSILAEIHERVARLQASDRLGLPPRHLRVIDDDMVLIGKATKEHKALLLLRNQVYAEHCRMHKASGIPFGVNPDVDTPHYRCHVMMSVLWEMLSWSVFNTYREQKTQLDFRFDTEWNMYATPRVEEDTGAEDDTPTLTQRIARLFSNLYRRLRYRRLKYRNTNDA